MNNYNYYNLKMKFKIFGGIEKILETIDTLNNYKIF